MSTIALEWTSVAKRLANSANGTYCCRKNRLDSAFFPGVDRMLWVVY